MRIALISDVHANLPALRAVFADAEAIGCDAVWCAGDVVGRGPHPNEVADELRRREVPTVQGNWDEAVSMTREQTGTIWATPAAESAGNASLTWTAAQLSEENLSWLRQLPVTLRLGVEGRSVLIFHGTPLKQNEYLWSDRPSRFFARIASDEADDLFCFGHTHESFHRAVGQSHFVAAGSVGCGSAEDPRARYAVIYIAGGDIVAGFRSVEYDRDAVLRDLAAADLPDELLSEPPVPHASLDPGLEAPDASQSLEAAG